MIIFNTVTIKNFLVSKLGVIPSQSQLELSFPPAATQLILMNVCFTDYLYSISCYLRLEDTYLYIVKIGNFTQVLMPFLKLQKFLIATVHLIHVNHNRQNAGRYV